MGFVDNSDHLISTYKIDRKSKKWWHRIFWHFIDVTVVNSFIIYQKKGFNPSMTSKQFRLSLVESLVGHKIPVPKGRKRTKIVSNAYKPQVSKEKRNTEASHMPIWSDIARRCTHCSTKANEKRSHWMCSVCDVPLCLLSTRNCFFTYHR